LSDENVVSEEVVQKIATALGETNETPLAEIRRAIEVLGEEKALGILGETLKVEAEEGLLTDDGQRRRTLGGIYFKLVKNQTTPKERGRIFGPSSRVPPKYYTWEESKELSTKALTLPKGEVIEVKVNIVGRPGRVIEKSTVVITSMQNSLPPNLPNGLPVPAKDPTTYIVYIAMKQWSKVKDSINNNPNDKLIIDGYPAFDKRIGQTGAMTIYAQSVTTQMLQQERRESQRAKKR
jgi:hypothetical protein